MAIRPVKFAAIGTGLALLGFLHASLVLLTNPDHQDALFGWGFLVFTTALALATIGLGLSPNRVALLLFWVGALVGGGCVTWLAISDPDDTGYLLANLAIGFGWLWNAWFGVQWWLGGRVARHVQKIAYGCFAAALGSLGYIPIELQRDVLIFLADDVLAGIGFGLTGFFLIRYAKQPEPSA